MDFKNKILNEFKKELENLQYSNRYINIYKFDVIDDLDLQMEIKNVHDEMEKLIQKIAKRLYK